MNMVLNVIFFFNLYLTRKVTLRLKPLLQVRPSQDRVG